MTALPITLYRCDFCDNEVRSPTKGWFVISVNDKEKFHACHECGTNINYILKKTGFSIEMHCTEWEEEHKFGWIKIITSTDSPKILAIKIGDFLGHRIFKEIWIT